MLPTLELHEGREPNATHRAASSTWRCSPSSLMPMWNSCQKGPLGGGGQNRAGPGVSGREIVTKNHRAATGLDLEGFGSTRKPTRKRPENDPKTTRKRPENDPKTPCRGPQNDPNDPKTTPKRPQNDLKTTFFRLFCPKTTFLGQKGRFQVVFRSFSGRFGVVSGRFGSFRGRVGGATRVEKRSFWGRFGSFRGRFGVSFGRFRSFWGRFGVVLGSFWGRFGVILGTVDPP